MATIGTTMPTFVDVAKRTDADGKIATVGELLNQQNEVLTDALWLEANNGTTHKTTVRSGLPTATWRLLNYGAQPSKSTTVQITDATGILETYAVIDKDLADLNGNTAAFRLTEDQAFLEGMNQQFVQTLFYGNAALYPERFTGFAPRYNTVNTSTAKSADNVIDAGGTGSDNTSIWLVGWGPNTIHCLYPKGSTMGLVHQDVTTTAPIDDGAGGKFQAYQTKYQWKCGLTVRDWRYAVRIANIDVSDLAGGSPANLVRALIKAVNKIPNLGMCTPVIYGNRAVKTWFEIQAVEKPTLALKVEEVEGKKFTSFQGIPFRLCDQLLNTEARVV